MSGDLSAGWVAGDFRNQWIMITLTQMLVLDGILTQGGRLGSTDMWMESFRLGNMQAVILNYVFINILCVCMIENYLI